jgi:hypothetical protein
MALLHMDGFDSYSVLADLGFEYSAFTGTLSTTGGRYGGGAYQADDSDGKRLIKILASTYTELWQGCAVKHTGAGAQQGTVFNFTSSFGAEVQITYDPSTNTWSAYRGDRATSLGTYAGMLNATSWHWVEARCVFSPTVGVVELWIDGVRVINLTAQNTRQNGSATGFNQVILGDVSTHHTLKVFDDWYVLDTSGSVNNARLGECRINTLVPTSDASPNNGTRSTGASNFSCVDEAQNNTTDYVDLTNTSGQTELYGMSDLSVTPTAIYAVRNVVQAQKTDVDALSLSAIIKSNTTTATGTAVVQTNGAYVHTLQIQEVDPDTSAAWTFSGINAMLCGVKVP